MATLLYMTCNKFDCWQSLALQEHSSSALLLVAHFKPDFSGQYIFFFYFHACPILLIPGPKKTTTDFWHDEVPDGYSFPVPKGRSHCLWTALSCSPGTREQFDIFLSFWKGNETSRPMIYPIYFPTLRSIRESCCCLFTLFPLGQRKWSFEGKSYSFHSLAK